MRCVAPLREAGAEDATLVHVMDIRDVGGLYTSMKKFVEPLLKDYEDRLGEMGFRTRMEIPLGDPAREINRVAKEADASLIVAGTHGESVVRGILLGSVAHRLLLLAERAFEYLAHIVTRTRPAETILYHVRDEKRIRPHLADRLPEFDRIDRERLDALAGRLESQGAAKVSRDVELGLPGPLIPEKVRRGGHTLLVIAGQGRGYMAKAFLGRVANHVVHRSTIPILVVPGGRRA